MRSILSSTVLAGALCLSCAAASTLFAQDPTAPNTANGAPAQAGHYGGHHGPMSPDEELSHLTKALNLTTEQQTQIKPVLQDRSDQLMQMRQDASLSREAKGAKMKSVDDESNTKLEAVLNDQQKTKYEKMVADRKQRMAEMRSRREGGSGGPDSSEQPQ